MADGELLVESGLVAGVGGFERGVESVDVEAGDVAGCERGEEAAGAAVAWGEGTAGAAFWSGETAAVGAVGPTQNGAMARAGGGVVDVGTAG